jgi:hypothetical protein
MNANNNISLDFRQIIAAVETGMGWDALHASHPSPGFCFPFLQCSVLFISGCDKQHHDAAQLPKL